MKLEVIKNTNQLEGSYYVEYKVGENNNRHWNSTSIFLEDEAQSLLHTFIYSVLPDYDINNFTYMSKDQYELFSQLFFDFKEEILNANSIVEIKQLSLPHNYPFDYFDVFFTQGIDSFKRDFEIYYSDICHWLKGAFKKENGITILGL